MGKLNGPFGFTGSFGDFVAYRISGSDKIIVRRKGKVSKHKRKTSPAFARVRQNQKEFGGRGAATGWIKAALKGQTALSNFACAPALHNLIKYLQELDSSRPLGERSILFSKNPEVLDGFDLTQTKPLRAVIPNVLECSVSKQSMSASVNIPALLPGTNFFPKQSEAVYQIVATLGIVPDLHLKSKSYGAPKGYSKDGWVVATETNWYDVKKKSRAMSLTLTLPYQPPDTSFALLLSIGIRYGLMAGTNVYASNAGGSAMILKVV
jgi:hypothetical protein